MAEAVTAIAASPLSPPHSFGDCLLASVVDRIIAGMLAAKLAGLMVGRGSGPKKLARERSAASVHLDFECRCPIRHNWAGANAGPLF
jgi:hypothetical protein